MAKLEKFLNDNNAKSLFEDAAHFAKEQLPANYNSYIKQKEKNIDSFINMNSLTNDGQEGDPVTFLGPMPVEIG